MKNRLMTERNAEDNKDVLFITQNFKTEGVSKAPPESNTIQREGI
jgi:hypothetical protein